MRIEKGQFSEECEWKNLEADDDDADDDGDDDFDDDNYDDNKMVDDCSMQKAENLNLWFWRYFSANKLHSCTFLQVSQCIGECREYNGKVGLRIWRSLSQIHRLFNA